MGFQELLWGIVFFASALLYGAGWSMITPEDFKSASTLFCLSPIPLILMSFVWTLITKTDKWKRILVPVLITIIFIIGLYFPFEKINTLKNPSSLPPKIIDEADDVNKNVYKNLLIQREDWPSGKPLLSKMKITNDAENEIFVAKLCFILNSVQAGNIEITGGLMDVGDFQPTNLLTGKDSLTNYDLSHLYNGRSIPSLDITFVVFYRINEFPNVVFTKPKRYVGGFEGNKYVWEEQPSEITDVIVKQMIEDKKKECPLANAYH
jgi:hypothetical protein